MILKMNNKSNNFYQYMGKFFGSRIVQSEINDRIYDDSYKDWYIYLKNDNAVAFISIHNNTIKNIYSTSNAYLIELLTEVKNTITISPSIVPKIYLDVYKACNLHIDEDDKYKNFVTIRSDLT